MENFINRKRKSEEESNEHLNQEIVTNKSEISQSSSGIEVSTVLPIKKKKSRLYQDSYLQMGFAWTGDSFAPNPKCIVCGVILANDAMNPSKLKRHFTTKHSNLSNKTPDYFQRLLKCQGKQRETFIKKIKISDRAQEASYLVAEIIAKETKPHTIAQKLILPACAAICKTMFGIDDEELKKIPLSDDTIRRRIGDMSENIEKIVSSKIKESHIFALQVDESTDIGGKAQLLTFVRFIENDEIFEEFLCCKELEQTTTGKDIFNLLNEYLKSIDLSWKSCVGICTDGAPSMVGSLKGFVSLAKRKNTHIISTHCFLHRQALISRTLGEELSTVLNEIIGMVNFIKTRPLKSRMFTKLCEEFGSEHLNLLLHTHVRWLSKGRTLNRVYELKEELLTFFEQENKIEFCELLKNKFWRTKFAYITDIFEELNKVNSNMQGRDENLLKSSDKIKAFKDKIEFWKMKVNEGNLEMFTRTAETKENIINLIYEHLTSLGTQICHYFPDICIDSFDWIRNPFVELSSSVNKLELNYKEEEELIEIRNDRTLRMKYSEISLESFWILIQKEYPNIGARALQVLVQFSTSYLCEQGFSTLVNIKTKKRERLKSVENEMRVCLSKIRPNIKQLCMLHQAHVSH